MPGSRTPPSDLVRLPVTLPKPLYDWLREAAYKGHRPMAELVREALSEYRDRRQAQLDLPMDRG